MFERQNATLLQRLLSGILYTSVEQADTGQLDSDGMPVNNPASGLNDGELWVRVGDPERAATIAQNGVVNNTITNIPVFVGINRFTKALEVIQLDITRARLRFPGAVSSLLAQPSGDLSTTTTKGRNFKPGRIRPVGSSVVVEVSEAFQYHDSANALKIWQVGDGTLDLTSSIPAASGGVNQRRWTVIALNPDSSSPALAAFDGTAALVTLPDLVLADIPSITLTDGYIPLAAVKLTTGDTSISETKLVDYRLFLRKTGAVPLVATTVVANSYAEAVKNTSGATVAAGDVGILLYDATNGWVYNRTTTANYPAAFVGVVLVGGANNATIYVARRGKVTANYAGTAPNAGQWLVTSTTGGSAGRSTTMIPQIFAVCLANGSGGTVSVQLLTQTTFVPQTATENIFSVTGQGDSDFSSTINGAPSATSVVYGAITTGAENTIDVDTASQLGKPRLFNSTRSTYRLITDVDVATNTITTVSSTDTWANTDAITIRSQTNTATSGGSYFYELDMSQSTTTVPVLTRSLLVGVFLNDSGGSNEVGILHPYEANDTSKQLTTRTQAAGIQIALQWQIPLIDGKFTYRVSASGAGTMNQSVRLIGYFLATP